MTVNLPLIVSKLQIKTMVIWILLFVLPNILATENSCPADSLKNVNLEKDLKLQLKSPSGSILSAHLGLSHNKIKECKSVDKIGQQIVCTNDNDKVMLNINKIDCDTSCYHIDWLTNGNSTDCYTLGDRYWYGGGEVKTQRWPLQNENRQSTAYVTGDFFHYQYGGLVENAWLTSDGFVIYSSPQMDLQVSFNASGDDKLCISALQTTQLPHKTLKYTICSGQDIKEITKYLSDTVWKKPKSVPDKIMMTNPVWSTWAYYKKDINQTSVMEFAKNILDSKIGWSHIEVDDRWEDCYGNIRFDSNKFPNPSDMIHQLKQLGFRIAFWVHPFANVECDAFWEGDQKGYWIHNNSERNVSQLVLWWNGIAGYLDTTNPSATEWYINRMKSFIQKYNINGLKFDAGEVSWIPPDSFLLDAKYVNQFTKQYIETISKLNDVMVEVRSAHYNQDMNFYLRMLDRNSVWGYENGLKTLIPASLLFFVFGYPFVLPDMIGGNDELPDRELYIRWMQTNALLPVMQFSYPPWAYDEEVIEIAREMVNLHRKYAPLFIRLAEEAVVTGVSIIRPLWWIEPNDTISLIIDSEFLVGDELLVAPVLEKGSTNRDIYLPSGKWKDELRDTTLSGPLWLRGYNANLKELPHFTRLS